MRGREGVPLFVDYKNTSNHSTGDGFSQGSSPWLPVAAEAALGERSARGPRGMGWDGMGESVVAKIEGASKEAWGGYVIYQ